MCGHRIVSPGDFRRRRCVNDVYTSFCFRSVKDYVYRRVVGGGLQKDKFAEITNDNDT